MSTGQKWPSEASPVADSCENVDKTRGFHERRGNYCPTERLSASEEGIYLSMYLSMALQPFVGPWQLFQFLNPIHSRLGSLDGGSGRRKAATYTRNNTHTHRYPCLTWDSNLRPQRSSERLITTSASNKPTWHIMKWVEWFGNATIPVDFANFRMIFMLLSSCFSLMSPSESTVTGTRSVCKPITRNPNYR
jgi:hypothetical protein